MKTPILSLEKHPVSVVTGGAGFIGSNLCDALLKIGHDVICIDNLCTGAERNIESLKHHPSFTFIKYDVTSPIPVFNQVDYIFHLASPASVPDYQRLDEETALVNSVGTRNMLKVAKAYKSRFLYTSTSEIYGNPLVHPQTEEYWGNVNPDGVRACYDESKRYGEMITMLYHRKFDVDTRIVRIFNTYGPNMRPDDGRVVSNFINQAISGSPITMYGDGTQTRSFCYVDDLVAGIMAYMFHDDLSGEIVNLGNPEEYTMIDLAKKIVSMTESSSHIEHKPLPVDDPVKRRPDVSKAKRLFGWEPRVTVDEGLTKTIQYYRLLARK
jgi:nucleoside-diphosphate-sugar epimerase